MSIKLLDRQHVCEKKRDPASTAVLHSPVERSKARTRLADGVKRGELRRVSEGVFEFRAERSA
jgi:hypothetical protein